MSRSRVIALRKRAGRKSSRVVVTGFSLVSLALVGAPLVSGSALSSGHTGIHLAGARAHAGQGIVPPKNPTLSLPPTPDFITSTLCSGAKDTAACNALELAAVANARKVLEGMGGMTFSIPAYLKLTPDEQLFVTANLERTERGVVTAAEMTKSLDAISLKGAQAGRDPNISHLGGSKLPGGGIVIQAGANWATGYDTPLGSDYGWMYDDGPGGNNGDCAAGNMTGCWGHRDNILDTYATKSACHGLPFETVMGTAYLAKGAVDGDGETQVFAGVCGKMPTDSVFTWTKAESLLGIK